MGPMDLYLPGMPPFLNSTPQLLWRSTFAVFSEATWVFFCVGMLSAAASLGMILLWDVDGGLTQIDKYLYSSEDYIKVSLGLAPRWRSPPSP